ncbi:hypothetical protein Pla86_01860 [Planctomycetes bacterium Pla86]|uniref:Uncharacterized protein n=1 Tax=Engelhardtia mirabilis TaxID=2528011 RepID=A0A518BDT7_9BACT|nr:hypothetical protein Pla133_01860 [Planctomycetes bacterium Pla133]QDU99448.1 hypothetical protein Pla86_01860 [Planctomycetes bacterium Pla86]
MIPRVEARQGDPSAWLSAIAKSVGELIPNQPEVAGKLRRYFLTVVRRVIIPRRTIASGNAVCSMPHQLDDFFLNVPI